MAKFLYDSAGVRALEALAVEQVAVSGLSLMTQAGEAAWRELSNRWPRCRRITVVCGQGNNAGDGYVLARAAKNAGLAVRVVQIGATDNLQADARTCFELMLAADIQVETQLEVMDQAEVVVDALFGLGLDRAIAGPFADAVERINHADAPVLSIDMPSGIDASTGCCLGSAVHASVTITFIGLKQGLYTADGPDYTGDIVCEDLGVAAAGDASVCPSATLLDISTISERFSRRRRTAHKGDQGHVLLIGGAPGMVGAIRLAGEAAARVGSGLISIAAHPQGAPYVNVLRPELMVHAIACAGELDKLLRRADVVAIGPGLGQSDWATALLANVLNRRLPLVIDADALNLLAKEPINRTDWVLTPHPGEAARLLDTNISEIHADRFAAAANLQTKYGGSVVLKGAGSIIFDGGVPAVVRGGNPGMASGGMGDVLTGIVAGLMAQGLSVGDAARLGATIHAAAADRAASDGERGLLASDLMTHIRALVN